MESSNSDAYDKYLFTPGPLTTSRTVKQAMLRDLGSRDTEFIESIRRVRNRLLAVAGLSQQQGYECVLMQGSGTFTVESVISSAISPKGKLLVIVNGAYGQRIVKICARHGIDTVVVSSVENEVPELEDVERALATSDQIEMVAVVHCETTAGIMNPIQEIGELVQRHGKRYFVDSMSAFGAVSFDFQACHIDYLVSSANKCIEGVPGFGYALCRREALESSQGWARTVSLDLLAQWEGLEKNGQFRFTPPTHAILAFDQALIELEKEGGVAGRGQRYRANYKTLIQGMLALGFDLYVPDPLRGYIITAFRYPQDDQFDFRDFYHQLSELGFVIYPGKVTDADCFRIGNIGRLYPRDVEALLHAIRAVIQEMGVAIPVSEKPDYTTV
jgi:2-aminoethylphosphonate-pyruvate transaminase